MILTYVFWISLIYGIAHAVLKIRLIPINIKMAYALVIIGAVGLWGGDLIGMLSATPVAQATSVDASGCAYSLSIQPTANSIGMSYDSGSKILTQPTFLNTTSDAINNTQVNASFVMTRNDGCGSTSTDSHSFSIESSSSDFTNVSTGLTYNVVPKDTYGAKLLALTESGTTLNNSRTLSFTPSETKTLDVWFPISDNAIRNTEIYKSHDVIVTIGGQAFAMRLLRTANVT